LVSDIDESLSGHYNIDNTNQRGNTQMSTMSFSFTGLRKDGSKAQITATGTSLRQCEQKAKETLVKITQTVRVTSSAPAENDASAA
jgi:hypothetical protein